MKSHLTKLSVALLSAVFVLSCQDPGAGPVGPDGLLPQFAKDKGCPESGHPSCKPDEPGGGDATSFTVTHVSGDIIMDVITARGVKGWVEWGDGVFNFVPMSLSSEFIEALRLSLPQTDAQIDTCFGVEKDVEEDAGPFDSSSGIRKGKRVEIQGSYRYSAWGPDGEPVLYLLELSGTTSGASFPPGPGETTTVTWTSGYQSFEGGVEGCVGGGGRQSAQKNVTISGIVTIEGDS